MGSKLETSQLWDFPGLGLRGGGGLNPGETWGEEEAGEGAEPASHDSPTSTPSAQWHLRSPAPNSNLVRLPKAESAPARHESSIPRGPLPETLASNQGRGQAPRLQEPRLSGAARQDHESERASWVVKRLTVAEALDKRLRRRRGPGRKSDSARLTT